MASKNLESNISGGQKDMNIGLDQENLGKQQNLGQQQQHQQQRPNINQGQQQQKDNVKKF